MFVQLPFPLFTQDIDRSLPGSLRKELNIAKWKVDISELLFRYRCSCLGALLNNYILLTLPVDLSRFRMKHDLSSAQT